MDTITARSAAALTADRNGALTPDAGQPQVGPLLLSVSIDDAQVLQRCYLPFLRNGGLFVPGMHRYPLRQRLCLILKLPPPAATAPDPARVTYVLMVRVAWLATPEAQGGRGVGVGLHFENTLRDKTCPDTTRTGAIEGDTIREQGWHEAGGDRATPDVKTSIESLLAALL
ncbi:MAG: hypothetical protein CMQ34_09490 [Gammaproteobacteria bacterium]|nr:hypothetical protein [Gammaproteobacteria bacterium]|tara:strand:+ start:804 stop:1316 length:513 start_codon:yes stop_codon:yes gene_type:complete